MIHIDVQQLVQLKDCIVFFRWLLLDFKREFSFEDSLRLFEVISSHYLELNSDKALVETDKVIAKEFEHDSKSISKVKHRINQLHGSGDEHLIINL